MTSETTPLSGPTRKKTKDSIIYLVGLAALFGLALLLIGPEYFPMSADTAIVDGHLSSDGSTTYGGCRETGNPVPYDYPNGQTFGEPLSKLDFFSSSYKTYPTKKNSFNEAWQECARLCNLDSKCHTYTAHVFKKYYSTKCYLHDPYSSRGKSGQSHRQYSLVSGVCRLNK